LIIVHNISDTEQNYSMNTYKVVQSLTLGKKQNISDNKIPPFTTLILTNK
jgi:hypothetical protein